MIYIRNLKILNNLTSKLKLCNFEYREISNSSAIVTKIHRNTYTRMYPTLLVLPDGSTINIRYPEPRMIIKLPLDINTLNEKERKIRLNNRKPRRKIESSEELTYSFNANKYINMIKKK